MIELKNISKTYQGEGGETLALAGINLTVDNGDFIAIMGPSGCGKTTLLNILGLIDAPSSGEYAMDGDILRFDDDNKRLEKRRGRIGFIFQSFNLIDELDVIKNVELPLKYMGISSKERKARAYEILKKLKISHRAEYYPHQLSGGQQQLVAIARAIVFNPKIIIADEPTGNLDSETGRMIMETLNSINAETGATVVVATHNRRDAEYARRVLNMSDGKIVTSEDFI